MNVPQLPGYKAQDLPPIHVETDPPPVLLEQMLARTEAIFNKFSAEKPHWTVLTAPRYEPEQFEAHKTEFFESGRDAVRVFKAFAARAGVDLTDYETCFELGCGVGRITMALAELFPRVIGADIAAPMLDEARRTADEFKVQNVEWLMTNRFATYDSVGSFDVFFTSLVLQHNPPPIQGWLLRVLLSKLRSGGVGYFQTVTYRRGYEFRAPQYMSAGSTAQIEMHVYPLRRLIRLVSECGCELLDIRENGAAGTDPGLISNTLLVQKI